MRFGRVSLGPNEEMKEHSNWEFEELIVVVSGTASVFFSGKLEREVARGDFLKIGKNTLHSIKNLGDGTLEYYYVLPDKPEKV